MTCNTVHRLDLKFPKMTFKGVKQSTIIRTKTNEVYHIIVNFNRQLNVSIIMAVQMALSTLIDIVESYNAKILL